MALEGKTLAAIGTSYATLQDGDLFAVERAGVVGRVTRENLATDISAGVGLKFIVERTASDSGSLNFTEFDPTLYSSYAFVLSHLRPETNDATFLLRTSGNNGASYDEGASDYSYGVQGIYHASSPGPAYIASNAATRMLLTAAGTSNASNMGLNGVVHLYAPDVGSLTSASWQVTHRSAFSGGTASSDTGGGSRLQGAAVNGVRFRFSTGNITTGKIAMYGLRNS